MNVFIPLFSKKKRDGVAPQPWKHRLHALPALFAILTLNASAQAHAPPHATGIEWSESADGAHAVVRTNRGLIFQAKTGSFALLCGEAFQSSLTELAPFATSRDGSVFTASYEAGLQRSSADGCSFEPVTDLTGVFVADLQQSPGDPEDLFALALPLDGGSAALFNRRGALAPWSPLAPLEGAPDSVRIAGARPDRVYVVSMRSEGEQQIADVLSSSDHGETFSRSSLPLPEREIRAYLLDAGQRDADRVYLRTQTADGVEPERLLLSEDAGETFREVLRARGPLSLVSRPDEETVWAGGFEGLFRSRDGGASFTRVEGSPERVECLRVHDGRLYVCGYAGGEFGVLVSSQTAASSFDWFLRFSDVRARLRCSPDSDEGLACQYPFEDWAAEQLESLEPAGGHDSQEPTNTAGIGSVSAGSSGSTPRPRDSAGCSLSGRKERTSRRASALLSVIALWALRRSTPGSAPSCH